MNQGRNYLVPALIGGAAAGVASAVPVLSCLNCACCALVIGGGFLASFFYLKDAPPSPAAPYGEGALLGLLTGVFGAVINTVVEIPMRYLALELGPLGDPGALEEVLRDAEVSPEVREMIVEWVERFSQTDVALGALLVGLFFNLVIFILFALLGALLGVAVFHKKPPAAPYTGTAQPAPETPAGGSSTGHVPPPPAGQAPPPGPPPGGGTPPPPSQ